MRWAQRWIFSVVMLCGVLVSQNTVPGRFVVKFKSSTSSAFAQKTRVFSILSTVQARVHLSGVQFRTFLETQSTSNTRFPQFQYAIVDIDSLQDETAIVQSLQSDPSVDYVQPSYLYSVDAVPNDSAFSSQWNLARIGVSSLYEQGIINSSLPDVVVGIIDTGIDEDHPDLNGSQALNAGEMGIDGNGRDKRSNGIDDDGNGYIDDWRGYDFVDLPSKRGNDWKDRDNEPQDENGHGTEVAGIVGARSNNNIGVAGFGSAKVLPLRAFAADGNGSDVDIAAAIIYGTDNGAEIINMSFGDVINSLILKDAVGYAHSRNVVLVASSGNDGSDKQHYPSDLNDVISVGSVSSFDARSIFSSYSSSLDIMAPGESILTTTMGGGYTSTFSGTSAATPQVSGCIAVLKSLEKKSSGNTSNEMTNDEIRGLFVTTADDVGEPGWDQFTASGVIDLPKAIESFKGSNVRIINPKVDEIVSSTIPVVVTTLSPYFSSMSVQLGEGLSPSSWKEIFSSEVQHNKDSVATIDVSSLNNDTYVVRVLVKNSKGNDVEYRTRFIVDKSVPTVVQFNAIDSILIGNEFAELIEAETDIPTDGYLYYRLKNSEGEFSVLRASDRGRNHFFTLSSSEITPGMLYEYYTVFSNDSKTNEHTTYPTISANGTDRFELEIPFKRVSTTKFSLTNAELPAGHLLNDLLTVNGKTTVVMNEYNLHGDFKNLKLFQNENGVFVQKDSIDRAWIPRSFVRSENGSPILLVQDYGESRIYGIDTVSMKFTSAPLWVDSSDAWGSQLIDLNGDDKPEIVARSSSEILIFQNLGNNKFQIATRLSNPTKPGPGEAANQFGPPKTLVGDFTNSSLHEIVFADYDGDLVMYRQTNPQSLMFQLAWVDTSDLYEMSDYIAMGDFNSDGTPDIISAGHTNLEINSNREYDTPYWTVRIHSHAALDPPGVLTKKWEQNVFGVNGGTGNDNGITTGDFVPSLTEKAVVVLNLNPNTYVFHFDSEFRPVADWWTKSYSNSAIFDGATIGLNNGSKTVFYKNESSIQMKFATPFDVGLVLLSTTKVKLQWQGEGNKFLIYKGGSLTTMIVVDSVAGYEYIDSAVASGNEYFYAVQAAADSTFQQSDISTSVFVFPHSSPHINTVTQPSLYQMIVTYSHPLSTSTAQHAVFEIDGIIPKQSVIPYGTNGILVTVDQAISTGIHTIRVKNVIDNSGLLADTTQYYNYNATLTESSLFFAQKAELLSPTKVKIEFNEGLEQTSALAISNFSVSNSARKFALTGIQFDSTNPFEVILSSGTVTPFNALALRLEITLNESIRSMSGKELNEGRGQTLSIAQEISTIDNIVVFPNPVRYSPGKAETINFVNIPSDCKISIYTPSGNKVRMIGEPSTRDGLKWDLRDDSGKIVSSGIYLYRVEQLDQSGSVTNSILGKLVVLRK